MTTEKAEKEFGFMLEETRRSEQMVNEDQRLMGDACRELRLAHGIHRNVLAQHFGVSPKLVAELERRCSTNEAREYRAALKKALLPAATAKRIRNTQRPRASRS